MFYRDLFASLCFIFFGLALATQHPYFYFGAMMSACFSITAKKKMWENPSWSDEFYDKIENWFFSKIEDAHDPSKHVEFKEDEEIKPLPPLDKK